MYNKKFLVVSKVLFLLWIGLSSCIRKTDDLGLPDSPMPVVRLEKGDVEVSEGNRDTTLTFKVQVEGLSLTNIVVYYATVAGTASQGSDFEPVERGTLLFTPSISSREISIKIIGDPVKEADETLEVVLLDAVNAKLGANKAKITLRNDDLNPVDRVTVPVGGPTSPVSYAGYQLVWQDEFEGQELNASSWTFETGDGCPALCGWGNNELQFYQEKNAFVDGGYLVIEGRKETAGTRNYTSARIITKGKREFQYGRIDIRAALPEGRGYWPALWMLGANIDRAPWPACGEIDIMELTGDRPNRVLGSAHFGANVAQHQFRTSAKFLQGGAKFSEAFHVFSILWEKDKIQWLLDDEPYFQITPANLNGLAYPFNQPFFFVFNVAIGGNLPGPPAESTIFPRWMIVDYVRVFQPR
jgi:beta-glucanase (GH16 family)